ncbi:MAG TPA: hypothetical protein PLI65_11860 [Bacteroidales bacterium]|nr:hypothetical protein [Bacteroidales bacterium]HPR59171.1 hypothetical protein [Bacteroidales bacterium]
MTKKEKAGLMQDMIARLHESGQSQKAFALGHGIKLSKLRYWIRKQEISSYGLYDFIQIGGHPGQLFGLRFPNGVELTLPQH